jgi:hypothetical protein
MKKKPIFLFALLLVYTFGFQDALPQDEEDGLSNGLGHFLDEIATTQKVIDQYTPNGDINPLNLVGAEWLIRAVSKRERERWSKVWLEHPEDRQLFNQALNALAVSAAKKISILTPSSKFFAFHDAIEEAMMKAQLNIAKLKIYKIGLLHENWQRKSTSPNKTGFIWARKNSDDHPYCHLYKFTIAEDRYGGNVYGSGSATLVEDILIGCP